MLPSNAGPTRKAWKSAVIQFHPNMHNKATKELSKQGTVKEEQKRVKTTEELEAEAKQAAAKTEEELAKK